MVRLEEFATPRREDLQGPTGPGGSVDALVADLVAAVLAALEAGRLGSSYRCSDPRHPDHYRFSSATLEREFGSSAEMRAVYNLASMELLRDHGVQLRHSVEGRRVTIRAEVNWDRIHCCE